MAELYLGRVEGPGGFEKLVAIKRVLPTRSEDADFAKMLVDEARVAATLDHANVVKVMDFGVSGAHHYLVMEYLHGRDLHDVRRVASGKFPLPVALSILIGAAHGLHYAHEATSPDGRPLGLVHRDVSPSNVFMCFSGEVKVVDFGIAKATALASGTRSGSLKGKIAYMSPEQCRGGDVDRRSDVHALGNLLYLLTTGRRVFAAPNEFRLLNVVAAGEFERPAAVCEGYPPELDEIVVRALAFDPADRWPTAAAFADALERFALDRGMRVGPSTLSPWMRELFGEVPYPIVEATRSVPTPIVMDQPDHATSSLQRSSPWPKIAIAAVLAVGIGAGVWANVEPSSADSTEPVSRSEPEPVAATPPIEPIEPIEPSATTDPPPDEAATAEPSPDPIVEPERDKPRRSRKAKRGRQPRRTEPEPTDAKPSHSDLFLPPSKRSD